MVSQESRIFDDVLEKTLSNLMSGVESIASCKMHRNKAQLLFAKYDEKYIQKWVLHDEAVDLMVLKVQKFAMEDHYARLYGPRVMAKKSFMSCRARSPSDFSRESLEKSQITCLKDSKDPVGNKESKRLLADAFAAHPFSKFQSYQLRMDSNEDLQNLLDDTEKKSSQIWKKAFSRVSQKSVPRESSEQENLEEKSELRKKIDVPTIIKLYKEAKKGNNTE